MPEDVKSASQAITIAESFLKKHLVVFFVQPKKAVREDGFWLVEIDIGPIIPKIAKFKIDANSGEIMEYDLP